MKRLVLLGWGGLLVGLGSGAIEVLRLGHILPDIPLLAVVLVGLLWGPWYGLLAGFVMGGLVDLLSIGAPGVHLVGKATAGLVAGLLGKRFLMVQPGLLAVLIGAASLGQGLLFLTLTPSDSPPEAGQALMLVRTIVIPQALYDGLCGWLTVWLCTTLTASRALAVRRWLP